jgi:hypothetical protein
VSKKRETAAALKDNGLLDVAVGLAKHLGAFEQVVVERKVEEGTWSRLAGYRQVNRRDKIVSQSPVTVIKTRKLSYIVSTPHGEYWVSQSQISDGYVTLFEYTEPMQSAVTRVVPQTGYAHNLDITE